jgi:O-antigen/teichoic acid export membrane protein
MIRAVSEPSTSPAGSAPTPSTAQRTLRSTGAAWAIQLTKLLIGFGSKVALAWLLLPSTHGVYELALRIVTVAAAVRDLGLPYHLMRDARRPYGTVLAFVAASGTLLTVALVLAAPLFGVLDPGLPAVLRVYAVWVLLDGLAVVPRAFFERELEIGALVGPEIGRNVVVAVVAVGLAAMGAGVWSFVAGDLAGAALLAAWSWARTGGRMPHAVDRRLLPSLLRGSALLFLIWIAVQLVTNVDAFIVRWYGSADEVGLYAKAYWLVFLVAMLAYPRALFAALVETREDRPRFVELFRLAAIQLVACQVLASYFLLCNPERVLGTLLSAKWVAAADMLRVLAFVPFSYYFSYLGGEMLKAEHRDREWLAIELLNLASLVGFGVLLTRQYGPTGMAGANFLLLGNLVMAWEVRRVFASRFWPLVGELVLLLLVPAPIFGLAAWATASGSWARVGASLLATVLAGAWIATHHWHDFHIFFGRRGGATETTPVETGSAHA